MAERISAKCQSSVFSLTDEEKVKYILVRTIPDLWEVVIRPKLGWPLVLLRWSLRTSREVIEAACLNVTNHRFGTCGNALVPPESKVRVMTATRFSAALIFVALACVSITGCGEKAQVAAPPPPEVIVGHPLKKEVTQYLEFTGTTAALEFVEIRARVEGWLESVNFTPGSQIKKGDLLFVIDPRPFQAQVDQSEAALKGRQADLQLKQANLKRAQQLLSTASISQLQYDVNFAEESVGAAQVGIAKADLAKAQLDLAYAKVNAPTNGRVSRNYVDIGNLVGAKDKTLLTEIVNDSSVYVYFDVSERDLLMLTRKFPQMETEPTSNREKPPAYLQLADETGYPHAGKVDFVES